MHGGRTPVAPRGRESPPLASVEVEPRIPTNVGDEDLLRVNATIDAFDILDVVSMRVMTRIAWTRNRAQGMQRLERVVHSSLLINNTHLYLRGNLTLWSRKIDS